MNDPLVTVGIPTYDQQPYLEIAIQSVLAQSYCNIEIIVAEDSINENAKKNVNELKIKYPSIKFIVNPKHLGRVANYKYLLTEHARGELYINLDGDDYFTNKDFIKNAVEIICLEGINNVLFYQGAHIYKSIDIEKLIAPNLKNITVVLSAKNYINNFFKIRHFSHMSTLYNRREAINSGFYEKDIISSDLFSFLKLAVSEPDKKIILSQVISGVWLQHGNNISGTYSISKHFKNFKLYTDIFLKQWGIIGFSKASSSVWFIKSFIFYWLWYVKHVFKNKRV